MYISIIIYNYTFFGTSTKIQQEAVSLQTSATRFRGVPPAVGSSRVTTCGFNQTTQDTRGGGSTKYRATMGFEDFLVFLVLQLQHFLDKPKK